MTTRLQFPEYGDTNLLLCICEKCNWSWVRPFSKGVPAACSHCKRRNWNQKPWKKVEAPFLLAVKAILGHNRNSAMYGSDACTLCDPHRQAAEAALKQFEDQ